MDSFFYAEEIADKSNSDYTSKNVRSHYAKQYIKRITPKILWETMRDIKLEKNAASASNQLFQQKSNQSYDFIYERMCYLQHGGNLLKKKLGIPLILEVNSPLVEERRELSGRSLKESKARKLFSESLKSADGIIVVSSYLKNMIKSYGVPDNRILIIPNGVHEKFIKDDDIDFGIDARHELTALSDAYDLPIGFKLDFMEQCIGKCKNDVVRIKYESPAKALIFDDQILLMPVMLNTQS